MTSRIAMETRSSSPRVLIFSLRNVFRKALFRCPHLEFENIICEIDSAELLAPEVDPHSTRSAFATRLAYHAPITLNPGVPKIPANTRYEIFFTVCGWPSDLLLVNAVSGVRAMCRMSVCLLDELWVRHIPKNRFFLRALAKFDLVLLYYSETVRPLSELLGGRCVFLPPGVDAISFCPYPNPPERVVDVCSIGRRAETTHQRLLEMARDDGLFYLHDSIGGSQAIDSKEHRALLANVAKRSRYFLVNPASFDKPDIRGGQSEIGNRYFEGAASGAIMVGQRPENQEFAQLFDWPEAVAELRSGSCGIDMVIRDLDQDPERQDRIRRTGVVQSLLRHDWVYRWEAVLAAVGLQPMQGALERKRRLRKLAEAVLYNGGVARETVT
jgi:hypothetical protein